MATQLRMPQLGESVVEGTVGKWLKTEGEWIEKYEPLLEVITDKVDTEITAPDTGYLLQVYVNEGETVPTGRLLAYIGEEGDTYPKPDSPEALEIAPLHGPEEPRRAEPVMAPVPPVSTALPPDTETLSRHERAEKPRTRVSPVVAQIAAENNVDLTAVTGTGKGGRVTKKDILRYIEERDAVKRDELLTLTPMRKTIAEHMVRSVHTSPHASTMFEVDFSRILSHRAANRGDAAEKGVNLTPTAYLVQAAAEALGAVPVVNSAFTDEGIQLKGEINIGVAVAVEDGLIVPVIRNADGKSLLEIARAVNDLAHRAREKKLLPDEVREGTFTITNHGVGGSLFATPIINQPQAAILGVGVIQKRVVVLENDAFAIRPMAYVSLTFDHRIMDGAVADQFMTMLKRKLEEWS